MISPTTSSAIESKFSEQDLLGAKAEAGAGTETETGAKGKAGTGAEAGACDSFFLGILDAC